MNAPHLPAQPYAPTQQPADIAFLERPILLLFSDDSTLFFARRMRTCLQAADPNLTIHLGWVVSENALSYRQMVQLLPEGPDFAFQDKAAFHTLLHARSHRAILTSRTYRHLGDEISQKVTSVTAERPCVIGFLGGLDFTPKNGYERRRFCDTVYVFPSPEVAVFEDMFSDWPDRMWQEVEFGHPSFTTPQTLSPKEMAARRDIYFFTQALSPSTQRGRLHMLRAMAAIAQANPDRNVWIKLRHLPGENQQHLHLEKYDYPGLADQLDHIPDNLQFTACTMDEALETAALGITCTSTAAIDVIRTGVPCMVHLDFVDNYVDPLVNPMRKLFADSHLITSLDDMLHLRSHAPDADWLETMFCTNDLGARVLQNIENFSQRPFQLAPR